MKRTIALRLISYISALIYFGAVVLCFIFSGELFEYWFSLAVVLIGFIFLTKSFMFDLDSSLYISALLLAVGVTSFVQHFLLLPFSFYYPWHIFAFAFASLLVFIVFRQIIHLKIFVILSIEVLLLLIYKNYLLPNIIFYSINGLYLLFVVILIIASIKKNTKKNSRSS